MKYQMTSSQKITILETLKITISQVLLEIKAHAVPAIQWHLFKQLNQDSNWNSANSETNPNFPSNN